MTTCLIEPCERQPYCRGFCTMHYSRLRRHGDPETILQRLDGEGWITPDGYLVMSDPKHPLANPNGRVREHRRVLYDAIGPGPHPCADCGELLEWKTSLRTHEGAITVDHRDRNKLHNVLENLDPVCSACNTKRSNRMECAA